MIVTSCNENKTITVNGIEMTNMDTTAIAGNDFYQYACGGWIASHPLKPEYARYGIFDALNEKSQEQVRNLISEISKKTNTQRSIAKKISDLYALAMDSVRLNKEGASPLLPYLKQVKTIHDKSEITAILARLMRNGIAPFFDQWISADDKHSSVNICHFSQGGYNIGDRDYYFEQDDRSKKIRTKYIELIEKLFILSGHDDEEANRASTAVMLIETQMAKVASPREALRDPITNYHKISLDDLIKLSPGIDWIHYFPDVGLKDLKELNVSQLQPIAEVSKVLRDYPLEDIKYFLTWTIINYAANFLSDDFSNSSFEFYGKTLSGREKQLERWKRAVNIINDTLGEAVGQLYVEKHFPPAAKKKMLNIVHNLQTALGERIDNLLWMGNTTKIQAREKLTTFHIKIGYPDKWRDYSELSIDKEKSYLENIIHSNNFDYDYNTNKFDKSVDKDEWHMTPQTVNAYYNATTNEICFPAAILQPPFFNFDADDAVNYGAIGVIIGHEMTHGFDDQGRKFDKDGNLKDWWTTTDAQRFKKQAQVLVDYFNNIMVLDSVHANGCFTLGENIADQGGLQISWQAYQNTVNFGKKSTPIDGFTDAQRFFIAYATIWAMNIRDTEILHLTKTDPHALSRWRVNGALPQIDAWYEAFQVTPENALYIPKENRVKIW